MICTYRICASCNFIQLHSTLSYILHTRRKLDGISKEVPVISYFKISKYLRIYQQTSVKYPQH